MLLLLAAAFLFVIYRLLPLPLASPDLVWKFSLGQSSSLWGKRSFVSEQSLQLSWVHPSTAPSTWGSHSRRGFICIQALVETSMLGAKGKLSWLWR